VFRGFPSAKGTNYIEVRIFKYLGTVISNTDDETEEIKVRTLAANSTLCKPYLDPNISTDVIK
jgi:hypothetical protein